MITDTKTIAVIGAGPVGLAAAAHAIKRGLTPIVVEAGPHVGHAVREWAHVPMFSPWAMNVDAAARDLLAETGWTPPEPTAHPTGEELATRYLEPLAAHPRVAASLRLSTRVRAVSRKGLDKTRTAGRAARPFELRVAQGGLDATIEAAAVIDASGTWSTPNPAGSNGLPAPGEDTAQNRIRHGMPDVLGRERDRYVGRRVAVIGSGHSAVGALIDLGRLAGEAPGTELVWLHRGTDARGAYGGGRADRLSARGALGLTLERLVAAGVVGRIGGFRLERVEPGLDSLVLRAAPGADVAEVTVDELIVASGFRPDLSLLRELRVALDPALECPVALAPLIDPNVHSCGTVRPHGALELAHPEPGFFIAGMKAYGRAPTFLLATGHEQVRSIVSELAGDREGARRVELQLPETGVCSGPGLRAVVAEPAVSACCGGPPDAREDACCRADEAAKAKGEEGCGCGTPGRDIEVTPRLDACCA